MRHTPYVRTLTHTRNCEGLTAQPFRGAGTRTHAMSCVLTSTHASCALWSDLIPSVPRLPRPHRPALLWGRARAPHLVLPSPATATARRATRATAAPVLCPGSKDPSPTPSPTRQCHGLHCTCAGHPTVTAAGGGSEPPLPDMVARARNRAEACLSPESWRARETAAMSSRACTSAVKTATAAASSVAMARSPSAPDLALASATERARAGAFGPGDARQLLDELRRQGTRVHARALNGFLAALVQAAPSAACSDSPALAVSFFSRMSRAAGSRMMSLSFHTYDILMDCCIPLAFFGRLLRTGLGADEITLSKLLRSLCKAKRTEEALDVVLHRMHELGCEPNVFSYNIILKSFCDIGNTGRACELLRTMMEKGAGCSPDVRSSSGPELFQPGCGDTLPPLAQLHVSSDWAHAPLPFTSPPHSSSSSSASSPSSTLAESEAAEPEAMAASNAASVSPATAPRLSLLLRRRNARARAAAASSSAGGGAGGGSYLDMWRKAVERERRLQAPVPAGAEAVAPPPADVVERRTARFEDLLRVPREERDRVQRNQVIDRAAAALAAARAVLKEPPPAPAPAPSPSPSPPSTPPQMTEAAKRCEGIGSGLPDGGVSTYDGSGGSTKYTDKWAERSEGDGWSKWGDKWDEHFDPNGHGIKQGETWWAGKYGDRWNRTWGEQHNGSGWVHKYGRSSSGEHWDTHVPQETWYERFPHFGFYHCFENSVQLRSVKRQQRPGNKV
ncbi:hypothetical protein HU200_048679 [Digitaria exilis]|uniref:Pentatricopeptide repeat-containing protein n=1 Tax=Digitaria exilis TaxID=1010633 RepID=A0A835E8V6_9POAL|nr:hypothetical protein HU200_048679 [Digitaria exilis]